MSDTPATEGAGAPVTEVPAEAAPEPAAPARVPVDAPKQRKVKSLAVALHAPAVRKSASAPVRSVETPKPVQISFRVSGVVAGDTLNVRNGPSEYHPAVGRIPASGRGVQIVGACRDLWCPIRHGRLKGWANRYYLAEDVCQQRPLTQIAWRSAPSSFRRREVAPLPAPAFSCSNPYKQRSFAAWGADAGPRAQVSIKFCSASRALQ